MKGIFALGLIAFGLYWFYQYQQQQIAAAQADAAWLDPRFQVRQAALQAISENRGGRFSKQ